MASTPLLTHFAHAYIVKSTVLMKSLRLIAPHYPNKEKNNMCRNVYIGMNSDRIIETTSITRYECTIITNHLHLPRTFNTCH